MCLQFFTLVQRGSMTGMSVRVQSRKLADHGKHFHWLGRRTRFIQASYRRKDETLFKSWKHDVMS